MPYRGVIPPHVLRRLPKSSNIPENTLNSMEPQQPLGRPRSRSYIANARTQGFVPDHLLRHLADSSDVSETVRARVRENLAAGQKLLKGAAQAGPIKLGDDTAGKPNKGTPYREVYDAEHSFNEDTLPGKLKRSEGEDAVKDKAVNEAYTNVGRVLDFYKTHFDWHSIDNDNVDVISSVHFGKDYENAFWDPQRLQMVFGDGDEFLNNFTGCIDVIGHELTHAVTDHTSPLDYYGQPGALNEHISDVFGIMVKQKVQDEKAEVADWLIGEDCIMPGVKGVALRSMKEPGTAYNDTRFGKDPQVGDMASFETTFEDNGGVHIYSGIPNKAFYLVAKALGGYSWEKAGKIWWKAMNSGRVPPRCTFQQFADVTVDVAEEVFDKETAKTVRKAWKQVGVKREEGGTGEWCNIL